MFRKLGRSAYTPVDDSDRFEKWMPTVINPLSWVWVKFALFLLGFAFIGRLSYSYGYNDGKGQDKNILGLNMVSQNFEYNASFGGPPSPYVKKAWDDLFPKQKGFFSHPTVAPQRSDFAVFHLLHCLKGMRHGYWMLYSAATEGRQLHDDDLGEMGGSKHFSHCTDLLRQNLMCNADLTVEIKNGGGVDGFGTRHQCKDWGRLMEWLSEWEIYESTENESWTLHDIK